MTQFSANENLSAFLDGELTPEEFDLVQAELDRDPALRAELDDLSEVRSFLGKHGAMAAPNDFLSGLLERVDEEPTKVVQLAWFRRPLGVPISGLALAAAAAFVFYLSLPTGAPVSEPELTSPAAAVPVQEKSSSEPERSFDAVVDVGPASQNQSTIDPDARKKAPPSSWKRSEGKKVPKKRMKGVAKDVEANSDLAPPFSNEAVLEKEADVRSVGKLKQEEEKGQRFTQVPFRYTLTTQDSEALMQLAGIAARYQGELLDTSKNPLHVEELQGAKAATVLVQIPAHALQDFGRALGTLGSVQSEIDNSMFAGDPVEVRVQVRLAPGAPGTADPKKSSPKQAL